MAFTQAQLDALEEAMAQGTRRVKYADKEVEYPSLKDMIALRDLIQDELGLNKKPKQKFISYNKGVYPHDNQ